ncbi:MAG: YgjP-like metallopeptidase domain-containing protein [Pseudomonadota bacterium]
MDTHLDVAHEGERWQIAIKRRRRRTFGITVYPDGSITAAVPIRASMRDVRKVVGEKARWIARQRAILARPTTPRLYFVHGEHHRYLGRRLRLRVFARLPSPISPQVRQTGRFLDVYEPTGEPLAVRALLRSWYQAQAAQLFAQRLAVHLPAFPGARTPRLRIKAMKTCWGSINRVSNGLSLNVDLIRAPLLCLDYVVIHELCHLDYPHHGPSFWRAVAQKMPGWQSPKQRLDRLSRVLHIDGLWF